MMIIELEISHTFIGTSASTFVVMKDGKSRRVLRAQRGTMYATGQLVTVTLDPSTDRISWS